MGSANKVTSNFIWRLLERFGAQGVTLIVSIVLARLLEPEVYGTVAIITVFTTILQVFVDSGLGSALIQKKDADEQDFSTIFWFNVSMCILLYILLFLGAPAIASYYNRPELTLLIRVLGIILIISGVKNIQISYVSKNMIFKKFFFSTLGGTIAAACVGIILACSGFGVWAIIMQNIVNQLIGTIILWITVPFKPKLKFSFNRFRILFSFGWKMLLSGIIDTIYNQLRQMIIGKRYQSEDLAYYNKGMQFPNLIVTNVNTSIDSVLFTTMAEAQNDRERVKSMTRRSIKISTFVMMPMMIGLAACADSFIPLLLTEKWVDSIFYLRIFCFTYAFYPIATANLNAIKSLGRSDLFLKMEIVKKIIGFMAIFFTMSISVEAMAWSLIFTSIASQVINAWPNKRLLNYPYIDQLKDMMPQIGLSVVMGIPVYLINMLHMNYWVTLMIQIPLGIVLYVCGAWLFKMDSFSYCFNICKGIAKSFLRNIENTHNVGGN